MNIQYSIPETTIYTLSGKFNTKSCLYRYDKMRPLFFKIAHGPFQRVKWLILGSGLNNLSLTCNLFRQSFVSHLFPLPCGVGNAVPREGFDLSVIILASLLVFPMLGCRHSLLRLLAIFHVLSSGMHIFKHFYLLTLASRGLLPSVIGVKCKSFCAGTSIC